VEIELLYFEGCPYYQTTLKYLEGIIMEKKLDVMVKMVKIKNDDDAVKHKFLGSPTIRVNDQDIDSTAREKENFSMGCRLYLEDGKLMELPSKKMIRHAIEKSILETSN
jgi:glutaredoxin